MEAEEDYAEIIKRRLYLSSYDVASDFRQLRRLGTTHILTAGSGLPPRFRNTFKYLVLDVEDCAGEDLLSHIPTAVDFIKSAIADGGCVLVHCAAGISRSPTIVIAYLMHTKGMSLNKAFELVQSARPIVHPINFIRQLKIYEAWRCQMTQEQYLLWRLECLAQEGKQLPYGTWSLQGVPPEDYLKREAINKFKVEYFETFDKKIEESSLKFNLYSCNNCTLSLFTAINIKQEPELNSEKKIKDDEEEEEEEDPSSFFYIEQMQWMRDLCEGSGMIHCPRCTFEVGVYDWREKERKSHTSVRKKYEPKKKARRPRDPKELDGFVTPYEPRFKMLKTCLQITRKSLQ